MPIDAAEVEARVYDPLCDLVRVSSGGFGYIDVDDDVTEALLLESVSVLDHNQTHPLYTDSRYEFIDFQPSQLADRPELAVHWAVTRQLQAAWSEFSELPRTLNHIELRRTLESASYFLHNDPMVTAMTMNHAVDTKPGITQYFYADGHGKIPIVAGRWFLTPDILAGKSGCADDTMTIEHSVRGNAHRILTAVAMSRSVEEEAAQ